MTLRTLTLFALTTALVASCAKKDSSNTPAPSTPSVVGTRHFRSMECHWVTESHYTAFDTVVTNSKDTNIVSDFTMTILSVSANKISVNGETYTRLDSSATVVTYYDLTSRTSSSGLYYYPTQDSIYIDGNRQYYFFQGDSLHHSEEWNTYINSL